MTAFAPIRRIGLALVAGCFCASAASAQPNVSSLEGLKVLESTNSRVTLTDATGQEFNGTVADATAAGLSLKIGKAVRQFAAEDIRTVRVQKEDSLGNGAAIGAVTAGALMVAATGGRCTDGFCWTAVGIYTGIGALIGMGIDAGIHRKVLVYSAPSSTRAARVSVDPLIAPTRTGLRLTITF